MYRVICVVLSAIITLLSSLGLNIMPREKGNSTVAAYSEYKEVKEVIEESFDFQKINTVEINLDSTPETTVTLEADGKKIYERKGSESYRFCAFKTIETDNLKVTVTPPAKVKDVTVSFKTSYDKDFRVVAYICSDTVQSRSKIDEKYFDIITDVIMIRGATYDKTGEITVDEEMLRTAVNNVRDAIGERKVNVHMTFLGPGSDPGISDWNEQMNSLSKKNSQAFRNPNFIKSINKIVDEYGFDGIFFDYEYPIQQKYWNDFCRMLKKLDSSTDKKIGIAVSDWNVLINKAGIDACDMIEFMQYGRFDGNGNHSSFDLAPATVDKAREFFIDTEKVDLGVPFFARPADRAAKWPEYRNYADELGMYSDTLNIDGCGKCYFNSYQTIYDKTAYALAYGLGGMMVWHFTCDINDADHPLSLFGCMGDCMADRIVEGEKVGSARIC